MGFDDSPLQKQTVYPARVFKGVCQPASWLKIKHQSGCPEVEIKVEEGSLLSVTCFQPSNVGGQCRGTNTTP